MRAPPPGRVQVYVGKEGFTYLGIDKLVTNDTVATIFLPADSAMLNLVSSIGKQIRYDMFDMPNNVSLNVSKLHIIPGVALKSTDLPVDKAVNATTLLGPKLKVFRAKNGTVTISVPGRKSGPNGPNVATVLEPDLPFNKAIVHIVDRVLMPPLEFVDKKTIMSLNVTYTGYEKSVDK
ncbi:hypothetical protein GPECTOR_2g1347 [Gonium pectorale]|uniref:FAS1 domain-containing protein n=1 Tax=Gonium pectorale TaxID=33097 RepID=A0A150H0V7_GONPE|nr:hypothetical protein GPECTOR_2g1347 [Gonium pectorale]|eukprot:KXZ55797.1 hypothetical protein GPECTOR_2g1347 [Gonium pectorale]